MTNPENHAQWGVILANAINDSFPNIAAAVRPGVPCDCSNLASMLQDPVDNTYKSQVEALCQEAEHAMDHVINQNAHLENRITDLETQLAQAKHALQAKDSITATLAEQLSKTLVRANPIESRPRRMTTDPAPFNGDEKDVKKRQQEYVNWRSQLVRAFSVDENVFTTEFIRIQHIAGLLGGSAYKLYRQKFDAVITHKGDQAIWPWNTYGDCLTELNKQFETLDLTLSASQAFDNLWMAKKPFQNFIAEFTILAEECGKTETQKVESLQLKVSQELANEMAHQLYRPTKDNFPEWCKMYQTIYDNLVAKEHQDKLRSAHPNNRPYQPQAHHQPQQQRQQADAADPMVLDAAHQARPTREDCYANNLCLYCKRPGHFKNDCEEKKQADVRRNQAFRGYGTGYSYGRGTGRGQPPHFHMNPPVYPRLRALEQGYVIADEATSRTSSPAPSINTPDSEHQGKE